MYNPPSSALCLPSASPHSPAVGVAGIRGRSRRVPPRRLAIRRVAPHHGGDRDMQRQNPPREAARKRL